MNVMKFESAQCERTRSHMDSYLSNELLVETTSEMLKHLATCADCSRELDARTRVRDALRHAASTQVPSESLRQAIHARLKDVQPERSRGIIQTRWAVVLAGLAVILVAAVTVQQWRSLQRGRELVANVLNLGVSDHLHCAIRGHNYPEVASTPEELRAQLGPQYAGLLPVVQERLTGFELLEAHLCQVPGSPRQYVHFIARRQGKILSVVLTRRDGESFPPGHFLAARGLKDVTLYQTELRGMSVAGFESSQYFGFVVSDLKPDEILQIAINVAPPLKLALDQNAGVAELKPASTPKRRGAA